MKRPQGTNGQSGAALAIVWLISHSLNGEVTNTRSAVQSHRVVCKPPIGMERFRALNTLTPLVPMRRDPGGPARWQQVYGQSFEAIVDAWLTMLPRR